MFKRGGRGRVWVYTLETSTIWQIGVLTAETKQRIFFVSCYVFSEKVGPFLFVCKFTFCSVGVTCVSVYLAEVAQGVILLVGAVVAVLVALAPAATLVIVLLTWNE